MTSQPRSARSRLAIVAASALLVSACRAAAPTPAAPVAGSGDAAFTTLATFILRDHYKRHPSAATDLGIHAYDSVMDDASKQAFDDETAGLNAFRQQLVAIDPATLTLDKQLDREQLVRAMDAGILADSVVRSWTKDPDFYDSGVTNAAYVIMKRKYAPAAERLRHLIDRERKMPAFLDEGRKNLTSPVRIFTEIAVEQIDGNIRFFKNDVPAAFTGVTDKELLAEFRATNGAVMKALADYKTFLQKDVLPKANAPYALGAAVYAKALAANEMIELPLDRLLQIAEADRAKNEAAFQATAKQIDASKPADAVLTAMEREHPKPSELLETSQASLDDIRRFIVDHHVITIPPSDPARVQETPPFLRSTTSASMDTPGPFETAKLDAFYNMTLPDPRGTAAEQEDYMRSWYYAEMSNVAVHEVYPGHYVQFLYAKHFPSDVRKVYGANSNVEGWAHYAEQMMIDEGFHADDPKYRLAQLQDALLRDARFIAGIRMHTQGMTVDEATTLFETAGHQPHAIAVQEAKRGAGDPLYGYYTMGKLMILKLRDDYQKKMGAAYTLEKFHDAFIQLGPLPLPLIRKAMVGDGGSLF
ncbi:MAG TPA: DUF885 domain-containing protein [Vicinamibacterales bacterium]|nr:DUF885 domain-containing protein [Vicinamibacterales bacterium]